MAIALRAAGVATGATAAITAVNPAVPSGAAAGDLSVLTVSAKPFSTVITTPTGWTKVGEHTNGTIANAADSGSTKVALYYRIGAPVGAIGNIVQTGANTMGAVINTYSNATGFWSMASLFGADTANGTNYDAPVLGTVGAKAGDWVFAGTSANSDSGTVSAVTISGMPGTTLGTTVLRTNALVTTGNDLRLVAADIPVLTGVEQDYSNQIRLAYTNTGFSSGTTAFLRMREAPASIPFSSLTETFSTSPLDATKWVHDTSDVTVANGRAEIKSGQLPEDDNLRSQPNYTLLGSSIYAQVTPAPVGSSTTDVTSEMAMFSVQPGNVLRIIADTLGNTIRFQHLVNSVDAGEVSLPYDAVAHRWWRMREASGQVFLETAPDGVTWTVRHTSATPFWVVAGYNAITFSSLRTTGETTFSYNFYIDNVNTPDSGAPSAGPNQTVQPWSTVTLTATGTGTWAQSSGTTVALAGTGLTRTFTAPASMGQQVLVFTYGGASTTVTVAKSKHGILQGGQVIPIRLTRKL